MALATFNPITIAESSNLSMVDLDMIVERNNKSYFSEALSFILEAQRDFNNANRDFYRTLTESGGNTEMVHESFGDFFSKVREIIDKLLKFIKSLFDRFVTTLNSFVKREKYLKNHEKDFAKFSNIHEFRMTGYDFTFSPDIPKINADAEFSSSWVWSFNDDKDAVKIPAGTGLKDSVTNLRKQLEDGDWYDNFRGFVIGEDMPIFQTDFAEELFKCFRNNSSSPEDFEVVSSVVISTYSRFTAHDKAIADVKHTKDKINNEYNSVKKKVDKMMSMNYKDGNRTASVFDPTSGTSTRLATGEEITNMDLFIKTKVNQIQEMANIHAMAFAAKLDALNDCFKQDKILLYRALSKIQGSVGKEA